MLNDAKLLLVLETQGPAEICARVVAGGPILPRKGITYTASTYRQEYLGDNDRAVMRSTRQLAGIGYAVSYVKDAVEMAHYRGQIGSSAHVIAKLERRPALLSVATDGAELYRTEERKALGKHFGGRFDSLDAAEVFGRYILGAATDHYLELRVPDRDRIFNLGYYTWVEQQGVTVDEFVARRDASFWSDLLAMVPAWDRMITDLNARTGVV